MAGSVEEYPEMVSLTEFVSYEKLHKERQPRFLNDARQDPTPGGQGLALPNWTIVPVHFHCPLLEDYSRILHSAPDPDTNLRTFMDHRGRSLWTVEDSEGKLEKHETTMYEIQAKLVEAISAVENELDFWRAVQCLESARSSLWSCHKKSSLDFTVGAYMGHAILRAALLQNHHIHKQQIKTLLSRSFEELYSTWKGIDTVESNNCLDSLRFSCIIGICWIRFFQGQISEVNDYLHEADSRRKTLDKAHFRGADRDFDTIYLRWAMAKAQGNVEGLQKLADTLGYKLTDLEDENDFIGLLDADVEAMKGNFTLPIILDSRARSSEKQMENMNPLEGPVRQFIQQLQAGYVANSWLLVGVPNEAERCYNTAKKSGRLLLEAAAQVGLGNVYMRRGEATVSKEFQELMYAKAVSSYQQGLVTYQDIGYRQGEAIIYCALGILNHKQNLLKEARSLYWKGLSSNAGDSFQLHFQLSWLHFSSRDWQAAESSLRLAKSRWASNPSLHHLEGAISVAKLLDDRCKMTPALKITEAEAAACHLKEAIKGYRESQRNLGILYPIWLTLFEQQKDAYEQLVWCIASTPGTETDRNIQALVWSERSRSRSLVFEQWQSSNFFQILSVKQELKLKNIPGLGVEDLEKVQALELTRFDALDEKLLWQFLGDLLEKCQVPDTLVLEYHVCADFGILIMVIKIGHGILKMVQIPFTSAASLDPGLTKQSLSALVTGLISNLGGSKGKSDSDSEETLKNLYKILLKPVEKYLEDAKEVIIIPHEVLFNVPFQALMDDSEDRFFIERVPLSYAESLRSLITCWCIQQQKGLLRQEQQRARKTLVVGINEHKHHPNLAEAERESATVADILTSKFGYTEGYALMGNNATKEQLMASLKEELDIIHIASHGLVNEYLEDGAILCSHPSVKDTPDATWTTQRDGQPNDFPDEGFISEIYRLLDLDLERSAWEEEAFNQDSSLPVLRSGSSSEDEKVERVYDEIAIRAEDLQRLRLGAKLVVLSACQTAKGVILGEGVAGIGRALLMAGVRCTILSQWQVSDRQTSALMKDIYNELANGLSVSKAMQKAMVNVITRDKERCRFTVQKWAPFIPLGLSFLPILEPQVVQQKPVLHIKARTSFYHILLIAILSFIVVPLVHLAFR